MAFAFLFIGIILIIASARGTLGDLGTLLKSEFTGSNNFFYWLIAIGIVGAIGYNQKAQPFSRAFLTLIIISMIIANKGVYANFMSAIQNINSTPATSAGAGTAAGNTVAPTPAPQQPSGSSSSAPTSGSVASSKPPETFAEKLLGNALKLNPITSVIGGVL